MTLLITAAAAVITTVVWYCTVQKKDMKLGTLCLMYWGASLMWLIDSIVEYVELGSEFFAPESADMINDAFLGISVVIFGLIIWLVILLIKDPSGIIKNILFKKNAK